MSGYEKPWFGLIMAGLQPALEGVVQHYATRANNPHAVQVAQSYIALLKNFGLSQTEPDPLVVHRLVETAQTIGDLYQVGNFRGVLQQSFAVLSALPGDPSSRPPTIPPPPGSDD